MTPAAFRRWLADMQSAGLARSDAECGRLLGTERRQTVGDLKARGLEGPEGHRLALACRALLHRLEPYG